MSLEASLGSGMEWQRQKRKVKWGVCMFASRKWRLEEAGTSHSQDTGALDGEQCIMESRDGINRLLQFEEPELDGECLSTEAVVPY